MAKRKLNKDRLQLTGVREEDGTLTADCERVVSRAQEFNEKLYSSTRPEPPPPPLTEQKPAPKNLRYNRGFTNSLISKTGRPISLLNNTYKLFTKIITNRVTRTLDENQPREQAGFRKVFSTIDHLHSVNQLIEKCAEYRIPLVIGLVDYNKALILWRSQMGVRQGDTSSPKLFTACLEIFRVLPWENKGLEIDGERLNHLRFADDIIVFASTVAELQQMLKELNRESLKNASREEEIKRRITLGWQAFGKASAILKNKEFPLVLKRQVYDQCITPTVTYGSETWNLTKKQLLKLRSMQREHERIMLGVT
ncbi:uncharacterized protein LOC119578522 [Penaeus monodon]|uniref:uncharacterized protein LOC119578522 n=1 Tax=Penaeus monodon TaxID=6687 RepID=UPI0018A7D075|nr:uncharacterized protein LOC119578522 [Penaeus monodon]